MADNNFFKNADLFNKLPPSYYLKRSNHFGTQPISSIEGLQSALDACTGILASLAYVNAQDAYYYGLAQSYADNQDTILRNYLLGYIDGSLNNIRATYIKSSSTGVGLYWNAGLLDVSIITLSAAYVDGSLAKYIKSSSTGFGLYWNAGLLDVSVEGGGMSQEYIDGSLAKYIKSSSTGVGLYWNAGLLDVSVQTGTDVSLASRIFYDPSTLSPSLTMITAVGGIPAGTTVSQLYGDSVTAILNDLLFPTVNPTYVAPSASFAMTPSTTLYEVSTNTTSLQFDVAFNRGQILIGVTEQAKRSGLPNNYVFTGIGLTDASSSSLGISETVLNYFVQYGNQSWSANVGYDEGPQPYDNKGNPFGSPLLAGTLSATPVRSIEGAYPYFATTVDLTILTKQSLVSLSTNPAPSSSGMALVTEDGINKQKIEIPIIKLNSTPLIGIRTYNTATAQWEYEGGTAPISLTTWTTSAFVENIQGYLIDYTLYTYNGPDRGATSIRLEF